MDTNIDSTDNRNESAPIPNEIEIIESWTFLGDESTNPTHHQDSDVDNVFEHPDDDDTKLPTKTSRSSSSYVSDNFLTVTNHGTDGDISDGISVISDCDSIGDRHSPMPRKRASPERRVDYTDEADIHNISGSSDVHGYSLVQRSTANEVQVLNSHSDSPHRSVWWNPSNIILFGLIVAAAAILSSQCWKINLPHENVMPEMSLLAQRIHDLEKENLALKVEVNRLVELHHAGHDHSRTHQSKVEETRSVKQKKVWTGADDAAIHIPKRSVKKDYCKDEFLNSDDLFASYNFKKCDNIDDVQKPDIDIDKSKHGWDDRQMTGENRSQQFDKKNSTKDDSATNKRHKFAESKFKNAENQRPATDNIENVRNEKIVSIQEERQKLFDEATEKYLNLQKKLEKKQEKDRKKDAAKTSKNDRQQPKDTDTDNYDNKMKQRKELRAKGNENTDSEWYDKMMKQREELRAKGNENKDSEWYEKMMKQREELRAMGNNSGGTKRKNKENWYTERGNEREKVRGKREKQSKSKQYR